MLEDVYNLYENNNNNYPLVSYPVLPFKIGNDEGEPKLNIKMYVKPFEKCPICYEQIIKKSDAYLSVCGHAFHKKCIFKAYEVKQLMKPMSNFRCPMCRTSLGTDMEEINERYDLYDDYNELDNLESFWIKKDFTMPLICKNKHYLGMNSNCVKCQKYRNDGSV